MMVKRKLDGAVDESSADCEIQKSDATVHKLCKIWRPVPSGTRYYGRLAYKIWARLEILKACSKSKYCIRFSISFSQGTALFQQL